MGYAKEPLDAGVTATPLKTRISDARTCNVSDLREAQLHTTAHGTEQHRHASTADYNSLRATYSQKDHRYAEPPRYKSYRAAHVANEARLKHRHSMDHVVDDLMTPSFSRTPSMASLGSTAPLPVDLEESKLESSRRDFHKCYGTRRIPSKFQRSLEMLTPVEIEQLIADAHTMQHAREACRVEQMLWDDLDRMDPEDVKGPSSEATTAVYGDQNTVNGPLPPSQESMADWTSMRPVDLVREYVLGPFTGVSVSPQLKKRAERLNKRRQGRPRSMSTGSAPRPLTAHRMAELRPVQPLDRSRYEGRVVKALQTMKPTFTSVL
ncbi:hypothetical protein J8273_0037 [Carpediemonas membranifera]|uniref:Uncharacterized protein n=1 Tax=Carpediemonas membranifera TaxID=201153 RepID=A0A8J6AYX5_9EUKA|nr:hypothetical protein J8273_0037 [Carpediemonas membranifera]|eukprot:KAG9394830.1 hypothetical protein J8273_0037 [Carpediemonas membranifera]